MRTLHRPTHAAPSALVLLSCLVGGCAESSDGGLDAQLSGQPPHGAVPEPSSTTTEDESSGDDDAGVPSGDPGDGGSSEGDDADEPQVKYDVSGWSDIPAVDNGCTKVDFLFVIDNSGSMAFSQANLIDKYPAFIDGIQSTLDTVDDYHVGVVTTDEYAWASPGCAADLPALVSKTQNGDCGPFADGHNYMTEADDLAATFACAADVGTDGDWVELPMSAALQTVQGALDGPGECNEGFLREDSLLVLVILTDEADGNQPHPDPEAQVDPIKTSPGLPHQWFDFIVAQRGGIETNVVVMSFINYQGGACEPMWEQTDGENIKQFTQQFTHGFLAGICEADYTPHFEQAIDVIADACNTYVNPG